MKKSITLIGTLIVALLVLTACGGSKSEEEEADASKLGWDDVVQSVNKAETAQEKFDIIGRYAFKEDYESTDIHYDLSNATSSYRSYKRLKQAIYFHYHLKIGEFSRGL